MSHETEAEPPRALVRIEDIERLKPARINPRTHSEDQTRDLASIIRKYGWTRPIFYDFAAEETVVGHGAQAAARMIFAEGEPIYLAPGKERGGVQLPPRHVPVMDVTGWTPEERRAYLIADNAIAERAGWDWTSLGSELRELDGLDFDLSLTGFDPDQLDDIFERTEPEGANPDEVPEPPKEPVTRAGDLWLMGEHRLLCGDATDRRDVKRLLDGKGDLTLTDPPYGIGYGYATHDDHDNEANARLVKAAFALAPKGKVWTPGLNNLERDIGRFGHARVVIWHKGFAAAGNGLGGASTIEPILILDPPRRDLPNNYLRIGTDRAEVEGQSLRELHPCPKPVELYERLARAFSHRGDVIYEPFAGSGTTLIACERMGRECRAIEVDPAYCDVVIMRWQQLTGGEAEIDGRTFAEVKAERLAAEPVAA